MSDRSGETQVQTRAKIRPVAVSVFLGGIGGGIAFPILPLLGTRLGLSSVLIGLILSANRITRLGMNPVVGAWIDRIGGKRPLITGLLIDALATGTFSIALISGAPGLLLLLGRAVWGLGSSMLIVGGMTLALNLSGEKTRGRSTAAVRIATSLGMPAGMLAGGVIAGTLSDNAAFLAATVASVVAAVIAWFLIPSTLHVQKVQAPGTGERRQNAASRLKEELRIVVSAGGKVKSVWLTNLLVFFSIQGVLLATLVLLIDHRHLTILSFGVQPSAGVLMSVMILASAGVSIVVGRLLDRIASRVLLAIPAVVAAAAGFVMLGLSRGIAPAIVSLVLIGIGMGGISIPLLTLLGDLIAPAYRGHAVGIYQFFGDIGGSLGPILGVELSSDLGFRDIYLGVAVLLVVIVLFLGRVRAAERRDGRNPVSG